MEKNTKKIVNIVLLIIWLFVIFYFSNQTGNLSSSLSDNVSLFLFNNITDFLIFIVRKIAHITEYFILAILMYNVFKDYFSNNKPYLITLILSILYACSDEIHQFFVVGRECLPRDVLIDTIGIILALIFIKLYNIIIVKFKLG